MKTLTLIRHAKSSWSNLALDDHERPLNNRGQSAAPKIGKYLAKQIASEFIPPPDYVLSSTAVRARTTAEIIAPFLHVDPANLTLDDDLYHASEHQILAAIQNKIPESAQHAILFGHNPGFEYLASSLLKSDKDRAQIPRFPTCATAVLEFPVDHWALIDIASATLRDFVIPRAL
ncbi:MAG: histidine phosphatase family protein [Verrucomicrobiota bacterium]